jgi:hypothetical protein
VVKTAAMMVRAKRIRTRGIENV